MKRLKPVRSCSVIADVSPRIARSNRESISAALLTTSAA
jgi:hypothetical protein